MQNIISAVIMFYKNKLFFVRQMNSNRYISFIVVFIFVVIIVFFISGTENNTI